MTDPTELERNIDEHGVELHQHQWSAVPEAYVCGYINQDGTPCGAMTAGWSWPGGTGMHHNAPAADKPVAAKSQTGVWNRWAPDALESPLAPAHLVEAYNRWQPDHLKIRRERS